MLQHATQFSFDRLKFIAPAGLIIGTAFCSVSTTKYRVLLIALLLMASLHGFKTYRADMRQYSEWGGHDAANRALVSRLMQCVDFERATFSSNLGVRAYANLLIGRSIYEYKSLPQAIQLNALRKGSAAVYLFGHWVYPDLQRYSQATIIWPDGRTEILNSEGVK